MKKSKLKLLIGAVAGGLMLSAYASDYDNLDVYFSNDRNSSIAISAGAPFVVAVPDCTSQSYFATGNVCSLSANSTATAHFSTTLYSPGVDNASLTYVIFDLKSAQPVCSIQFGFSEFLKNPDSGTPYANISNVNGNCAIDSTNTPSDGGYLGSCSSTGTDCAEYYIDVNQ